VVDSLDNQAVLLGIRAEPEDSLAAAVDSLVVAADSPAVLVGSLVARAGTLVVAGDSPAAQEDSLVAAADIPEVGSLAAVVDILEEGRLAEVGDKQVVGLGIRVEAGVQHPLGKLALDILLDQDMVVEESKLAFVVVEHPEG
jgi:hypothetical protein